MKEDILKEIKNCRKKMEEFYNLTKNKFEK